MVILRCYRDLAWLFRLVTSIIPEKEWLSVHGLSRLSICVDIRLNGEETPFLSGLVCMQSFADFVDELCMVVGI